MKVVENKLLPPKRFKILCIGNLMLVKKGTVVNQRDYNHEGTHFEQEKEMLFIFFYLWYVIEWMVRLVIKLNAMEAYHAISFEREAFDNDRNNDYLKERKRYSWLKYFKKKEQSK